MNRQRPRRRLPGARGPGVADRMDQCESPDPTRLPQDLCGCRAAHPRHHQARRGVWMRFAPRPHPRRWAATQTGGLHTPPAPRPPRSAGHVCRAVGQPMPRVCVIRPSPWIRLTSARVRSCHVISCHTMSYHVMVYHGVSFHSMACHGMSISISQ